MDRSRPLVVFVPILGYDGSEYGQKNQNCLIACLLAIGPAAASPAAPPLGLSVQVGRTTLDLLDSLDIAVVVHNPGTTLQMLRFPRPVEYEIDVQPQNGGPAVWTSLPASPPPNVTYPVHERSFGPGPTTLVVNDWNQLASGGWSPPAGTYLIRAKLLAQGVAPTSATRVTFTSPLPPSALPALKPGQEVTLAGQLDAVRGILSDPSGSARLSRRLLAAPAGVPVVIRGYAVDAIGGRTFTFERWARLGPPPPPPPQTAPAPINSE